LALPARLVALAALWLVIRALLPAAAPTAIAAAFIAAALFAPTLFTPALFAPGLLLWLRL